MDPAHAPADEAGRGGRRGRAEAPVALIVGAASRDLTDEDPRGWRLGGGVTYGALALAGLGVRVRAVIGLDAEARAAQELDRLRARGVELHPVPLHRGPVFTILESAAGRRMRSDGPVRPIGPGDAPAEWMTPAPAALVLAPVAAELDPAWADAAGAAGIPLVALGWQGLLRRLPPGAPVERLDPSPTPLSRAARLVVVSRDDVAPNVTIEDLLAALAPDATLAITAGEAGGVLSAPTPEGRRVLRAWRAIPADAVVDPVGAGDAFLAGLVAARISRGLVAARPGEDLRLGAAAASLTVEAPGLAGVPDLPAVLRRLRRPAAG